MTPEQWVAAANKMFKQNSSLTYKEVENKLAAAGHKRPSGLTQKGGRNNKRFGFKAPRTSGQNNRRKAQEQTSSSESNAAMKVKDKVRKQDLGVAQASGMPTPHREHLHSQDSAQLITEGAPGDYIDNVPSDIANAKTALESRIRTDYGNKYSVAIGVNNLRVIPKDFFDERVSPDDLPGIDIDETKPLDDQLNKMVKNGNGNGNGNGYVNGNGADTAVPNGNGLSNGVPTNGKAAHVVVDSARGVVTTKPAKSFAEIMAMLAKGLA
tara:strand:+ start:765 stop:1565 length:801 start_codon:yes stop_codon:yes gene_type:complete